MRLPLSLVFVLALAGAALANAHNYGGSGSGGYGASSAGGLSNSVTNGLIRQLKRDFKKCFRLEKVYRYDCYDDAYLRGAARLAGKPAYATAQKALTDVGRDITGIVESNLDPNGRAIRKGGATFRPIKPEALPQAKQAVIRSIDEAQTLLLRSADGGEHFSRIAAAFESNKVLLRSAMLWLGRMLHLA